MRPTAVICYVFFLVLPSAMLQAQVVRSVKKITDSTAPLDFDKKSTILIKFSTKQEVSNVSFVKLIGKKSLIESIREGLKDDWELQKRYPYCCANCFDSATGKFSLAKYITKHQRITEANVGFHVVPDGNFISHADSLWVTFGEKADYKYTKTDLYNRSYYKEVYRHGKLKKVRRKVLRSALEEQYQYLEPNTRYALLAFIGIAPSVSKIFDYLDNYNSFLPYLPMVAQFYPLFAYMQYREIEKSQLAITKYNSFIPAWSYCLQIYKDSLFKIYGSIHKSNSEIAYHALGAAAVYADLHENVSLAALLPFIREQYNRPLRDNPAPVLVNLESAISDLFNGGQHYLESVITGKVSILQPMDDAFEQNPDSLNYNLLTSVTWLDSVYIQLNQLNMSAPGAAVAAAIPAAQQAIANFKVFVAKSLKEATSIDKEKKKKAKVLNRQFQSPFIIDASTIINNIQTRGDLVLIPDFGVIYYGFIPFNANKQFMSVSPYFGVEVNWRPLDRNNTFRFIPHVKWYSLERWSTMVGVTLISVASPGKSANLFSKTSLMLGMGYRLGSAIRIIGGTLFFDKYTSYFSVQKKLAVTPYVGLSIDLSFQKIFGPVINAFK